MSKGTLSHVAANMMLKVVFCMFFQAIGWENMAFVFLNRYLDVSEVCTGFMFD